jgi:hypothetical protein
MKNSISTTFVDYKIMKLAMTQFCITSSILIILYEYIDFLHNITRFILKNLIIILKETSDINRALYD